MYIPDRTHSANCLLCCVLFFDVLEFLGVLTLTDNCVSCALFCNPLANYPLSFDVHLAWDVQFIQ